MSEKEEGGSTFQGGGAELTHERKGYPAPPVKVTELPKAPRGPAPGSGTASTSNSDK